MFANFFLAILQPDIVDLREINETDEKGLHLLKDRISWPLTGGIGALVISAFLAYKLHQRNCAKSLITRSLCKEWPQGLPNLGNTCYINASLQLLASFSFSKKFPIVHDLPKWIAELVNLLTVLETFSVSSTKIADPRRFIGALTGGKSKRHLSSDQQDSHEFLLALLSRISTIIRKNTSQTSLSLSNESAHNCIMDWEGFQERHLLCRSCRHQRIALTLFNILTIIPNKSLSSLERLLEPQVDEQLEGYRCESCKLQNTTSSILKIVRWPRILLLHTPPVISSGSISKSFCLNLQESSKICCQGKEFIYRLVGIIEHYGQSIGSGHYVACRPNCEYDQWFRISDRQVVRFSQDTAIYPYITALQRINY